MTRDHVGGTVLLASLLAVLLVATAAPLAVAAEPSEAWGRHIVIFRESFPGAAAQTALVRAFGGAAIRDLPIVNGMAVALPPGIANQLARRAEVERIDMDVEVHALGRPATPPGQDKKDDKQPPQQLPWGVDRIDADAAWDYSLGSGVTVAVIDTGIDGNHPDLAVSGGVNYVSKPAWKPADPNKWDDDSGHGTHVAGIIAALDNEIGVVGVAPEASLYAVKVLDRTGSGYLSDVISGIEWCVTNGIDVANMSLGTDADIQSFRDACNAAAASGLRLVAAAGNDGIHVDYPGAYDSVIAVAATDINDNRPSWSSPGPEVEVAAPGVAVYSTWKDAAYDTASGTSMAAPHVSGTLALVLALTPSADPCAGADPLAAAWTGCGLVDAGESASGIADYGDDLP